MAISDVGPESRTLIGVALWFHDAIYDPRSASNEEDSARLAEACLTGAEVRPDRVTAIQRLVLARKTHQSAGDPAAAVLLDIDLAILGATPERYWQYEDSIRAEFSWVPFTIFREKRAEILRRFLQRPALYQTKSFHARCEGPARQNLAAAIARLEN